MEVRPRALDADSQELAILRLRHGAGLIRSERYEEAEPPLLRAFEVLARTRHPADDLVRVAARRLAQLCEATGRLEEARRWRAADQPTLAPEAARE